MPWAWLRLIKVNQFLRLNSRTLVFMTSTVKKTTGHLQATRLKELQNQILESGKSAAMITYELLFLLLQETPMW